MIKEWNFPHNGFGQIRGVSDAGIETFTGTEIQSLAREICQNSLDAAVEGSAAVVRVDFKQYSIRSEDIPGYKQYKAKIKKAYDYWLNKKSDKTIKLLEKSLRAISASSTSVLRISDFNTIGLANPYEDSDEGWNALTKLDGGATKTGDKAGAFGIGKNAPFTNSDYRLVFYRTLNQKFEKAAQGMSRFISFPEKLSDSRNTMTTGIGYYGNPEGNTPVGYIEELDKLYKREEIGTDIFVYGFNGGDTWAKSVIQEILDNFLMAIYNNLLSVKVENKSIDATTLSAYLSEYRTKIKDTYWYHQVLSRAETEVFTRDFHGLGTLKLRLLVDSSEKLNRKILITRKSGMKLFSLTGLSRVISFSGILEMQGKELNEFFREMENPAHDKWLPSRHSTNVRLAKAYNSELKEWIVECIQQLGEHSSNDEVNVAGLSGVLQAESNSGKQSFADSDIAEGIQDRSASIVIQSKTTSSKHKGNFYGNAPSGNSHNKTKMTDGVITPDGANPAIRTLGGKRKRTKRMTHKGTPVKGGRDKVAQKHGSDISQELKNVRIIKAKSNTYRVSFTVPHDVKTGRVEIVVIGENGKANRIEVCSAKEIKGCTGIKVKDDNVYVSDMKENQKVQFDITVLDNRNYAMEVNVHEHH